MKDLTPEQAIDEIWNFSGNSWNLFKKQTLAILFRIKCPACQEIREMETVTPEKEAVRFGYNMCLTKVKLIVAEYEGEAK